MTAPIDLHYWPTPNGWKVSIALEEMGLPYRVRLVNIGAGEQKRPEFLAISPNGRMPAITDPEGPDGASISLFESGAILQYLARKTGRFCGATERDRIDVDQWLMWQMGGLGPMAGQAHHFLHYAPGMTPPQDIPYAKDRYRDEVARLYGVLDRQLATHEYVAGGDYSIADMAIFPWARLWQRQEQQIETFPNMRRWLETLEARPAVARGVALHLELRQGTATRDQQAHLFGRL
ncbi:glutathione S-transferase N-terminal domain-containing protein [Limimaricola variabilis]|uniref:glutathione S-transferase family protein n=1 Tax=Limimaricola variabilis TaxID=1492771 RepID=UPI002AC9F032|nr:glutathione S-transferase N-terminal domain-containing protein [Limimaricola variabilis]WPY95958.1 glutathione S-transferase N-terminal domain-containing protein [Limimaricola variabilis]